MPACAAAHGGDVALSSPPFPGLLYLLPSIIVVVVVVVVVTVFVDIAPIGAFLPEICVATTHCTLLPPSMFQCVSMMPPV